MCIAHVLSSFGMGGQERVALDLAFGQRQAGHGLVAVSLAPETGPLASEFRDCGATVLTVPKRPGFDVSLFWRLAWVFRAEHVRVVHTHNPQPLLYGAVAAKLAHAAAIHTKHGANPDRFRRVALRRLAARFVDAFVAVSEVTAEVARTNHEVALEKLSVIPNGIDLSRFHPDELARKEIRAELGIPSSAFVLGTVGRLAPEKNQALLIRAASPLLSEETHVIFIGDGPLRQELEAKAAGTGASGRFIHFAGARRDVPRLLAALDCFVLSSSTEGLPLVIPEAMAASLPVVSTSVGGIPGVILEGETGLLVPASAEDALRKALASLIADPARARRYGQMGRKVALERYSAARMVEDYLAVYEHALTRRKQPGG